jgi:transposase
MIDQLLAEKGHTVLRLPPYHPDLNPIELIWANVKQWVAGKNTTFKIKDVEQLCRQIRRNWARGMAQCMSACGTIRTALS